MNDLMREEFEAWFEDSGFYTNKELARQAWQASRECLLIELPEQGPSFTADGVTSFSLKNDGRNEAIKEIEVSIHVAGVKTK